MAYILDPAREGSRIKNLTSRILDLIGNMYPIDDKEIEKYVKKILEDFNDEKFKDFTDHEYSYVRKIKDKINSLAAVAAEKSFRDFLDIDKLYLKPSYSLQPQITPSETSKDITKSLYEKEGYMNDFEAMVINEIANLKTILLETKGDDRDNSNSEMKIRLGSAWTNKAGGNFKYFMVFDKKEVNGAYKLDDFLKLMQQI